MLKSQNLFRLATQRSMSTQKPKSIELVYFDLPARAECIRWALAIGGINFKDTRVAYAEVLEMKKSGKLPYGQLPILNVDGKTFAQSIAILRYAGKLTGLYPTDAVQAAEVDQIVDGVSDMANGYVPSFSEKDDKKRFEMRAKWAKDELPRWASAFEKQLSNSSSGYFVGNSLTIADLSSARSFDRISCGDMDGIPANALDAYPKLKAHTQKVLQHPAIKAWAAKTAKKK